jgi:hypothetical protein
VKKTGRKLEVAEMTRWRVIYETTRQEKKNEDIIQAVNIRPLGEIIEEARLR